MSCIADDTGYRKPSNIELLAMQGIAKRVEELMQTVGVGETRAMVPAKPGLDGGLTIMIIGSKGLAAPQADNRKARMAWTLFAMGSAAVYCKDSPIPITSIALADVETLKQRVYYILPMDLARE